MPDIIPRTEFSAEFHWDLIQAVTGIKTGAHNHEETRQHASSAFVKAWDYDFYWNILTHNQIFGEKHSKMGHAVYAAGGTDYSDEVNSLFDDPEDVFMFDMFEQYGSRDQKILIAEYNENYAKMSKLYPSCINMTGIYVTCMSGLIALLGWDTLLTAAGIDIKAFGDFTKRYCEWIQQYFDALAESEAQVVMIHDDIVWVNGAFLHPDFYREIIFPSYKKLFAPLKEKGKIILYTSDGDYTEFVDDVAGCGVNGFVLEPLTDMAYVAEKYGKTHCIIGNADVRTLMMGDKADIRAEVKRCMDIGRACPGFFMTVGNHIPSNVPVENALYYNQCYEEMRKR